MISTGGIIAYAVLLHMAVLMWYLPRRFGMAGLFGAQLLSLFAWMLAFSLSISTGEVNYNGFSSLAGIVFDTLLFNGVLLPVSVTAAVLRHREWGSETGPAAQDSRELCDLRMDQPPF